MNPSETSDTPARQRRPRRWARRIGWLVLTCSIPMALTGAFRAYSADADRQLEEAIAEADRLDPGWRLEELEARRQIPDEENSFRLVRSLIGGKPKEVRARADGKLARARQLADMPRGQFTGSWFPQQSDKLWDELRAIKAIAKGLADQAPLQSTADEALSWCRAAANAGRSIGDHPSGGGQMCRRDCVALSLFGTEQALARGEAPADALASWQRLLEDEERHPWVLIALRGDRALWHAEFSALEAGARFGTPAQFSFTNTLGPMWEYGSSSSGFIEERRGPPLAGVIQFLGTPRSKEVHAARLRYLNEAIEIAKLPMADQNERIYDVDDEKPPERKIRQPLAATHGLRSEWAHTPKKNLACLKTDLALLRCGSVMLALERYRIANDRWPATLADLVPAQLPAVPDDPFNGASLRYRPHPGGVVIYSIGPDGVDDLGDVPKNDLGFRLWDWDKR
jgi:hypothetical protein